MANSNALHEQYEDLIQKYLDNGYTIVSQTETSTILLSDRYRKNKQFSNLVVDTRFEDMSVTADYQATIRITKTGQVAVSGFTLDKHLKEGKQMKSFGKGCLITIIVILGGFIAIGLIGFIAMAFLR